MLVRKMIDNLAAEMALREIPLAIAVRYFEAAYLRETLSRTGDNLCAAARRLKIHRNTLSRKIREYSNTNSALS